MGSRIGLSTHFKAQALKPLSDSCPKRVMPKMEFADDPPDAPEKVVCAVFENIYLGAFAVEFQDVQSAPAYVSHDLFECDHAR